MQGRYNVNIGNAGPKCLSTGRSAKKGQRDIKEATYVQGDDRSFTGKLISSEIFDKLSDSIFEDKYCKSLWITLHNSRILIYVLPNELSTLCHPIGLCR
jgi:hypothetical protein